ncbi:MAG TPA: phosphopantetheine-binding protein [Caulobacteraceae bacterium]|jgi:acyl carrier protein|nr:phosphopantetheine-binding protein [Caulobacteraceae bacterium]
MDREATEQALTAIWAEVLRQPGVGRDDDFFALGGNSLLAVRMVALVRERLGTEAPIQRLLQSRTVAEFAQVLAEADAAGGQAEEGVI